MLAHAPAGSLPSQNCVVQPVPCSSQAKAVTTLLAYRRHCEVLYAKLQQPPMLSHSLPQKAWGSDPAGSIGLMARVVELTGRRLLPQINQVYLPAVGG